MKKNSSDEMIRLQEIGPLSYQIFRLAKAHRALAAHLLREVGLYPGQELLLMHLFSCDGIEQSELIRKVGIDPSTLTRMLQRIEAEGLIARKPSKKDKRAITVHLTSKGKKLEAKLESIWKTLEDRTVNDLDSRGREEALILLSKIEGTILGASHQI